MFDDGRQFNGDEIVIDPVVPAAARRALVTTAGRLVPFRQSPPRLPPRPAPSAARNAQTWTWGGLAVAFATGTLLAAAAGSIGIMVVLLIATLVATAGGVRSLFAGSASQEWARDQWEIRHAAVYWHRRYVVPQTDLDDDARPTWARAVAAANEIRGSYVVQRHIVDSVQVAVVLPQRLWEIAAGFAGLAQARGRQREILRQSGSDDELVAARVSDQDRKMKGEARRLEGRVRKLEEIAGLLRQADAAKRSETAQWRLGEVDDLLRELRMRSAGTSPGVDLDTERLRLEAQAVIEQANEAARDLARPDLGEADDSEEADDA